MAGGLRLPQFPQILQCSVLASRGEDWLDWNMPLCPQLYLSISLRQVLGGVQQEKDGWASSFPACVSRQQHSALAL